MIKIGDETLLSHAEWDRVWDCLQSLWGMNMLAESSDSIVGCQGLLDAQGVHPIASWTADFLNQPLGFGDKIIKDESWNHLTDWSDEYESVMTSGQQHELEMIQEFLKDFQIRIHEFQAKLDELSR